MKYSEALKYLYGLGKFGVKLDLFNIKKLLELSGNPHTGLKVVHVAGTNGKGSTVAFISSILKEARFKVGAYTSPHLIDFTERISVNGIQIQEVKAAKILTWLKPHIAKVAADSESGRPTYFEVVTAMAFIYFAEEQVDFVVLEVGLGGRLDATNVIDKPLAVVITNSDYDHMDVLGSTITSIAGEHAGIIKRNSLVITAAERSALKIIKEICNEKDAKLYRVGDDITFETLKANREWQSFNVYPVRNTRTSGSNDKISNGVDGIFSKFENLKIFLLGKYQIINACCAIAAVEVLKFHDILIAPEIIEKGLKKAYLPCRMEIVRQFPMVILDGAHNYPAAREIKKTLLKLAGNRDIVLIVGILKDKEIKKIIRELVPLASKVIVTEPKSSRAASAEEIYDIVLQFNPNVSIIKGVKEAIDAALSEVKDDDTICITGSLYTAGEAKRFFDAKGKLNAVPRLERAF